MSTPMFNTLAYARRLKEAGFTERQAEAQAEALLEAVSESLITRADLDLAVERLTNRIDQVDRKIDRVQKELEAKIDRVQKDLETKIDQLGLRLTVRLGGMMIAGFGALAILIKLP